MDPNCRNCPANCSGNYESYMYPGPGIPCCQYQLPPCIPSQGVNANAIEICPEEYTAYAIGGDDGNNFQTPRSEETIFTNSQDAPREGSSVYGPEIKSGEMICYRCEKLVMPEMDKYPTAGTHIAAFLFAIVGLALCMFAPYMCNWCGKPVQRCPSCGAFLTEPLTKPLKEPVPLR